MNALPSPEDLAAARLRLSVEGPVATITLDHAAGKNSQTPRMWRGLAAIGAALPDEIRVVVLRGAGSCFSAGLDVALITPDGVPGEESVFDLMQADEQTVVDTIGAYQEGFTWLQDPRFISIAQVHSHAIGAGFQLALACDLRVVADDVSFCMKEPALGLVPDLAGTKPLVEIVGYPKALEICATARRVGAAEAVDTGLAVVAVPTEDLEDTVRDLTQALLAHPVGAVRETKALLQSASSNDLDTQRLAERTAQVRRFRDLTSR